MARYEDRPNSEHYGFYLGPLRRDKSPDRLASLLLKLLNTLGVRCTDLHKISLNSQLAYAKVTVKSPVCEDYAIGMLYEPGQIMNIFDLRRITHRPYNLVVERLDPLCHIRHDQVPQLPRPLNDPFDVATVFPTRRMKIIPDYLPSHKLRFTHSDQTSLPGSASSSQSSLNSFSANKIGVRVLPHSTEPKEPAVGTRNKSNFPKSPQSRMFIWRKRSSQTESCQRSAAPESFSSSLERHSKETCGDTSDSESDTTCSSHLQFIPLKEQDHVSQHVKKHDHVSQHVKEEDRVSQHVKENDSVSQHVKEGDRVSQHVNESDRVSQHVKESDRVSQHVKEEDHVNQNIKTTHTSSESTRAESRNTLPQFTRLRAENDSDSSRKHGEVSIGQKGGVRSESSDAKLNFNQSQVEGNQLDRHGSLPPDDEDFGLENVPGSSGVVQDKPQSTSRSDAKCESAKPSDAGGVVRPGTGSKAASAGACRVDVKTSTPAVRELCFCVGRVFYHRNEHVIGLQSSEPNDEHKELYRGEMLHKPKQFRDRVGPAICALLNSSGGVLYFGVSKEGKAYGVLVDQKLEDSIRLDIDMLVKRIRPAVPPSTYTINFPGIMGEDGRLVTDLKILEIRVTAGEKTKERFFFKNVVYIIRSDAIEERETRCSRSAVDQERC